MSVDASTGDLNPILNNIFINSHVDHDVAQDGEERAFQEIKHKLKDYLKNTHTLQVIKANIRKDFITKLSKGHAVPIQKPVQALDLSDRLILSCMHHFFTAHAMHSTLSVFMAESGLDSGGNVMPEMDMLRLLRIPRLKAAFLDALDQPHDQDHEAGSRPTLLEALFKYCLMLEQDSLRESGCQTDQHGPSPREALASELQSIRQSFQHKTHAESTNKSIEERMLAYQKDCDSRSKHEVEVQCQQFRDHEANMIRQQERQKYSTELSAYRKQLDADYQARLASHLEREALASRQLQEQERAAQVKLHEQRQTLQKQIEAAHTREEMMKSKHSADMEFIQSEKYRLQEQRLHLENREAQVTKLEQTVLQQRNDCLELARREIRQQCQAELEANMKDREALLRDQAKVREQQLKYAEHAIALETVKQQVKTLQEEVVTREIEISALQKSEEYVRNQQAAEDAHLDKVLATCNPALCGLHKSQQILKLVEANAYLLQQLDRLSDGQALLNAYEDKDAELIRIKGSTRDSLQRWESEKQQLRKELGKLPSIVCGLTDLHADDSRAGQEKAKADVQVLAQQLQAMKGILQEKNRLLDTLSRAPQRTSNTDQIVSAPSRSYIREYSVPVRSMAYEHERQPLPRPAYAEEYERKTAFARAPPAPVQESFELVQARQAQEKELASLRAQREAFELVVAKEKAQLAQLEAERLTEKLREERRQEQVREERRQELEREQERAKLLMRTAPIYPISPLASPKPRPAAAPVGIDHDLEDREKERQRRKDADELEAQEQAIRTKNADLVTARATAAAEEEMKWKQRAAAQADEEMKWKKEQDERDAKAALWEAEVKQQEAKLAELAEKRRQDLLEQENLAEEARKASDDKDREALALAQRLNDEEQRAQAARAALLEQQRREEEDERQHKIMSEQAAQRAAEEEKVQEEARRKKAEEDKIAAEVEAKRKQAEDDADEFERKKAAIRARNAAMNSARQQTVEAAPVAPVRKQEEAVTARTFAAPSVNIAKQPGGLIFGSEDVSQPHLPMCFAVCADHHLQDDSSDRLEIAEESTDSSHGYGL